MSEINGPEIETSALIATGESGAEIARAKGELRERLRAQRHTRSGSDSSNSQNSEVEPRMVEHLMDVITTLPADPVACYLSLPTEPPTGLLREQLRAHGYQPLIPRIEGTQLQWAMDLPDTTWDVNQFGIAEPTNNFVADQSEVLAQCAAIIIPAQAIDSNGMRLGQGKGFYDRALETVVHNHVRPLFIGYVFDNEHIDHVPHEAHDIPVDVSVTECAVRWFSTPD